MAPARSRHELDLTRPGTILAVARRAGLRTSRRLGQHFLTDRRVLDAIVTALAPQSSDTIIEIGCGVGTLTGELAATARRVIALDVDPACVRATQITQRQRPNVVVVRADARQLDAQSFGVGPGWLVAGNLPYQLTGLLLSRLFEGEDPPARGVFLVQREVAARLAAAAGDWSLATLAVRSLASVERLLDVPPDAFMPPPAVQSSLIRLRPLPRLAPPERAAVLQVARVVFQQRRKTLRHGLRRALDGDEALAAGAMREAGLSPAQRPGTLGLDDWARLAHAVTALQRRGT